MKKALIPFAILALFAALNGQELINAVRDYVDISAPTAPASGHTRVYTRLGKLCSEDSSSNENCTGGSAGVGALTQIAQIVISGSSTSTATFSTISGSYTNLVVTLTGAESDSVAQGDTYMQVNTDTSADYDRQFSGANGSTAENGSSAATATPTVCSLPGASAPSNSSGLCRISIIGYAGTVFNKSANSLGGWRGGASSTWTIQAYWNWRSTSAITAVKFGLVNTAHYIAGTTFTLYGEQ